MTKHILLSIALIFAFAPSLCAQKQVRSEVRTGNRSFQKKDYNAAEINYRKALDLNRKDPVARYDLANTLYRTDRMEEAQQLLGSLLQEIRTLPADRAADVAHNAGNCAMKAKDYQNAVELFKESLRHRPSDEETRYNLALAQKLLQQQQQDGGGQNDEQEDQQEDQQQDQQQSPEQSPQDQQDNPNEDQPQQQPQENQDEKMSRENAEQILKAFLQDEKETQKRLDKIKEQQSGGRSKEKNW